MRPARWLVRLCLIALGAGLLAAPVAAQSVNRAVIDDLNEQLLYVALPLTLFVELTLVYAVYRFRDNDDPKPTVDDPALEITWTAATGVILVFVGVSAFFVLSNPYLTPAAAGAADPGDGGGADEVEIRVLAYQWGWEFSYPEANVTTTSRLVLPVDTDVRFVLSSADVIHSLYVPKLGIKQDVFPGHETVARTHATDTGEYRLYCAELCGSGHTRMHATVDVRNGSAYRSWLERQEDGSAG
ncbi:cytochrome c oxidase subunit II [Halobacteriales archaeon QS_5_70_15]|nr:MAG: cytochrome c oxidase subunit II [Halobacteriales archaeon QS_5_70_15]